MNTANIPTTNAAITPNYAPWINIAVGVLAIISGWVTSPIGGAPMWSVVIPGIVIVIVALITLASHGKLAGNTAWPVINILAGIWLIIAIGYAHGDLAMRWSNIVLGVLAIVTAVVSLSYERLATRTQHAPGQMVGHAR